MSIPYKNILVTLDGSELATQALDHAKEIALQTRSQLILLQVVPDAISVATEPAYVSMGAEPIEMYMNDTQLSNVQSSWVEQARVALQPTADRLAEEGIQALTVVEIGTPADTIIDYASENNIDLIVMSTHGRSGIARWVYGSVAAKVLVEAPCPVLLIRAQN